MHHGLRLLCIAGFLLELEGCSRPLHADAAQPAAIAANLSIAKKTPVEPDAISGQTLPTVESDPDGSLSPEEYEARGIPAIQNPWGVQEYRAALTVLVALVNENPALLPRHGRKRSSPVFRRMVTRENVPLFHATDVHSPNDALNAAQLMPILGGMLTVYGHAQMRGERVDREALEIYVQLGHVAVASWQMMDEVIGRIPQQDPRQTRMAAAIAETQRGTADILRGMLMALLDRHDVAFENLIWYASELRAFMPFLVEHLDEPARSELSGRITHLATTEPEPELAKSLKDLRRALTLSSMPKTKP